MRNMYQSTPTIVERNNIQCDRFVRRRDVLRTQKAEREEYT